VSTTAGDISGLSISGVQPGNLWPAAPSDVNAEISFSGLRNNHDYAVRLKGLNSFMGTRAYKCVDGLIPNDPNVDTITLDDTVLDLSGYYQTLGIIEEDGEELSFNEGCLSIPLIREDVMRKQRIRIQYFDENWNYHDDYFDDVKARIIQHEYDHLNGILFTDKVTPLKKKLLKSKLIEISRGKVEVNYLVKTQK